MSQNDGELIRKVYNEHKILASKFESAFVKDEYGELDLASHRIYHKKQAERDEDAVKNRAKIFSAVTTWAIIAVLTIIGNALVHAYVIPVLPTIVK